MWSETKTTLNLVSGATWSLDFIRSFMCLFIEQTFIKNHVPGLGTGTTLWNKKDLISKEI